MIVKLNKEEIDSIISDSKNIQDNILYLFKAVIPNWDKVVGVHQYPQVNVKTSKYIVKKLMDKQKEADELKGTVGMLWVNYGFGCTKKDVNEWEVYFDLDKIVYKD